MPGRKGQRGNKKNEQQKKREESEKTEKRKSWRQDKIESNRQGNKMDTDEEWDEDFEEEKEDELKSLRETVKEQQNQLQMIQKAYSEKLKELRRDDEPGPSSTSSSLVRVDDDDDDDEPPPLPEVEVLLKELPPLQRRQRYDTSELKQLYHFAKYLYDTKLPASLDVLKHYCKRRNPKFLKYCKRDFQAISSL